MTLAELYEALGKLENGSELISVIKAEISRLNGESAKFRTSKNEADAKITELTAKVEELEAKGTGDQTAAEKMQKQLDELNKNFIFIFCFMENQFFNKNKNAFYLCTSASLTIS